MHTVFDNKTILKASKMRQRQVRRRCKTTTKRCKTTAKRCKMTSENHERNKKRQKTAKTQPCTDAKCCKSPRSESAVRPQSTSEASNVIHLLTKSCVMIWRRQSSSPSLHRLHFVLQLLPQSFPRRPLSLKHDSIFYHWYLWPVFIIKY